MNFARSARCVLAIALVACATNAVAARDDDYLRLLDRFNTLATDPVLGSRAPIAMDRARLALAHLKEARRSEREHWIYMAERRIDSARASAEAESLDEQRASLQRENDRLQLAIARRDAEQARAELERQRLQAQIRAEEAERARREAEAARAEGAQAAQAAESARAEAEQAKRMAAAQAKAAALAKKEAELAAALSDGGSKPKAAAKDVSKPKPKAKPPKSK
ncbi:hypothetical protein [Dokdonella fugitiva]|jgi:hypothetical protein|uniref:hypothetical protein n=1 Tax=Dokdonella fugitiva TaxID=328517 RepID=UPI0015FAB0EE|nr:hypothetical protein [Dokdonella fugitiva]MBA8882432.1 phage-related minor tail protein [Dokdonella fugitiva]